MTGRQAIGSAARVTIERVTRELRSALPNSVRVNASNTCFEFLPVNAAGTYITLPVSASATTFVSARMNSGLDAATGRVAVYSLSDDVYDTTEGMLSPAATSGAPNANNEIVVTMASAYQFSNESIQSRYYLVADPVSFCIDGDYLFRYKDYGLLAASVSPFDVSSDSLTRNSIVRMNLTFSVSGESASVEHEVQLRKVP
jgi:MSHA biogenesis protein MshO